MFSIIGTVICSPPARLRTQSPIVATLALPRASRRLRPGCVRSRSIGAISATASSSTWCTNPRRRGDLLGHEGATTTMKYLHTDTSGSVSVVNQRNRSKSLNLLKASRLEFPQNSHSRSAGSNEMLILWGRWSR